MEWQLARQRKIAAHEYLSPLQFAELYARLGDKEQTLRYLELAARERASQLVRVHLDPEFDFLHSDPRFQAFLKNVGLTLPASTQAALH